jgi:hypothetical protein
LGAVSIAPRRLRTPAEEAEHIRALLSFLLVGAFISVLPVFSFVIIPEQNKEVITYMVGQLSGMATMALGFYFTQKVGQDALDFKRSETTGQMAEAVTTALKTGDKATERADAADKVAGAASEAAAREHDL